LNGFDHTTPHFGNVLESIGRLWKDWRAGLIEWGLTSSPASGGLKEEMQKEKVGKYGKSR